MLSDHTPHHIIFSYVHVHTHIHRIRNWRLTTPVDWHKVRLKQCAVSEGNDSMSVLEENIAVDSKLSSDLIPKHSIVSQNRRKAEQ